MGGRRRGVVVTGVGPFGSGTCPAPNPGGQGQCLFFGTSAATPHAAACDALVRQVLGATTSVATTAARLSSTATDVAPPGVDTVTGAGLLDCFSAVGGPTARCQNVTVAANGSCVGTITASQVNSGSTDPNGKSLTFSLSRSSFPLGTTPVTLTASNGTYTSTCTANVTVQDTTPPVLTAPSIATAGTCDVSDSLNVGQATATDNCASRLAPTGQVISKNGVSLSPPIPVSGGTVTLGIGTAVIQWTVSDGSNPPQTVNQTVTVGPKVEANGAFIVSNAAAVLNAANNPAAVNNVPGSSRRRSVTRPASATSRASRA